MLRRLLAIVGLALSLSFAANCGKAMAAPVRILAFGDSLTAGYGLPEGDGFVPQLQMALQKMGREVSVINGGLSGDTTAGGLSRLDWMLADKPDMVILELGANDMLRGLPPAEARANLDAIIQRIRQSGAKLLLVGMLAARNMGEEYRQQFDAIYPDLAKQHNVPLYPFFLDGVAARPELNQADGLHPTEEGVAVIVEKILPAVTALLDAS
ncbi:arylesterase [Dongia rigui]|uniref:Arylesterase n=1 Tax=Dongia rigui TaxID=940149 RepID=A0ABU5DVH9_9PROT|nr:arylesterase [Dongia rigui]MDY0870601.1 arylesterase [Dongia rigui]